jgi:hypothetical protein
VAPTGNGLHLGRWTSFQDLVRNRGQLIGVDWRRLAELTEARSTGVVSAWGIAVLHASLGDIDEAFRWLQTAIEERSAGLLLLRVHPRLDPIRRDPRYLPLVQRLGLADA